jgi:hypothetical protein
MHSAKTMPDPHSYLIRNKSDIEHAEALVNLGYPVVEPVLPHLLEWVQDGNWPVAHVVAPFLAKIGLPVVPAVREVLGSGDEVWKYFCIMLVVGHMTPEVSATLRPELERIALSPTSSEQHEEVQLVAQDVLVTIGHANH